MSEEKELENEKYEEAESDRELDDLESALDDIENALNNLENQNDTIHSKLKELLEANREIRKDLQTQITDASKLAADGEIVRDDSNQNNASATNNPNTNK